MLGSRVDMNFGAGATLVPLIREKKIKALAVTSAARSAELPNVPTMIECGLPSLTTVTHYGLFGPAGIPADLVAKLNGEMNESLKSAEVRTTRQMSASNRWAGRRRTLPPSSRSNCNNGLRS